LLGANVLGVKNGEVMKILAAALSLVLAFVVSGCDRIIGTVNPAKKLVTADGKVYMACAGTVEITTASNGYSVRLTDRDWNDAKTHFTDTEVYLAGIHQVNVRPMDTNEVSVCESGHFPSLTRAKSREEIDQEQSLCLSEVFSKLDAEQRAAVYAQLKQDRQAFIAKMEKERADHPEMSCADYGKLLAERKGKSE
jgi:hypothetical protein